MPESNETDQSIADKIRKLIAKANGTNHPAEAEAFFAKAQELMTRHAIDQAMLVNPDRSDAIIHRHIDVPKPWDKMKIYLLSAIATPNQCRVIRIVGKNGYQGHKDGCIITGYESDVNSVVELWQGLMVFAFAEMLTAEMQPNVLLESTKAFRQSFLMGFASRIAKRLADAKRAATREAEDTQPGVGLVLVSRQDQVTEAFREQHPRTSKAHVRTSGNGAHAGAAAANRANLGQTAMPGGPRAIGR